MTTRDQFDQDDAMRALLAGADPARDLPQADPAALAHLLEDVMSTDLEARPAPAAPTRRRTRATWLVAAAAAAVIVGVGGAALSSLGDDDPAGPVAGGSTGPRTELTPPSATSSEDGGLPVPGTTSLGYQEPVGRCATPDSAFVAAQQQAFSGTVTGIDDGTVTLQTTEVFAGEVAQTVQVQAPSADLRSLIRAADFQVGQTYLVAASDGLVAPCGLTGKATGQLQSLYEEAFVR